MIEICRAYAARLSSDLIERERHTMVIECCAAHDVIARGRAGCAASNTNSPTTHRMMKISHDG